MDNSLTILIPKHTLRFGNWTEVLRDTSSVALQIKRRLSR